ncbi:MAG: two-partner secretion domain-containing protein, partial [Candidatus Eutrophobiaceae bacterium]
MKNRHSEIFRSRVDQKLRCDLGVSVLRASKQSRRRRSGALSLPVGLLLGIHSAGGVLAAPQGEHVVSGQGSISRPDALNTRIEQRSSKLIVHWDSFNLSAAERVEFLQPSSSSSALNRIFDQDPSKIHGKIRANGQVLLINPSGIIFGKTAKVDVASLIASGVNISDADFMANRYRFKALEGHPAGVVINQGLIQAATGGSISLIGGAVRNEGMIMAHAGQVTLAAGRSFTMDFEGDGLLRFAVDEAVIRNGAGLDSAVENSGEIQADGGAILLTGRVSRDVFSNVVNNSGRLQAQGVQSDGGVVRLVADGEGSTLLNTGTVDVSSDSGKGGRIEMRAEYKTVIDGDAELRAASTQGKGGMITVEGERIGVFDSSILDASGGAGGGEIKIGGGLKGMDAEMRNSKLTLVSKNALLRANATRSGDGGKVIVWSDGATRFHGSLSASAAGAGDGGFAEISGKDYLDLGDEGGLEERISLDSSGGGQRGQLLLDP